jgi:hypothetical protein
MENSILDQLTVQQLSVQELTEINGGKITQLFLPVEALGLMIVVDTTIDAVKSIKEIYDFLG